MCEPNFEDDAYDFEYEEDEDEFYDDDLLFEDDLQEIIGD